MGPRRPRRYRLTIPRDRRSRSTAVRYRLAPAAQKCGTASQRQRGRAAAWRRQERVVPRWSRIAVARDGAGRASQIRGTAPVAYYIPENLQCTALFSTVCILFGLLTTVFRHCSWAIPRFECAEALHAQYKTVPKRCFNSAHNIKIAGNSVPRIGTAGPRRSCVLELQDRCNAARPFVGPSVPRFGAAEPS